MKKNFTEAAFPPVFSGFLARRPAASIPRPALADPGGVALPSQVAPRQMDGYGRSQFAQTRARAQSPPC